MLLQVPHNQSREFRWAHIIIDHISIRRSADQFFQGSGIPNSLQAFCRASLTAPSMKVENQSANSLPMQNRLFSSLSQESPQSQPLSFTFFQIYLFVVAWYPARMYGWSEQLLVQEKQFCRCPEFLSPFRNRSATIPFKQSNLCLGSGVLATHFSYLSPTKMKASTPHAKLAGDSSVSSLKGKVWLKDPQPLYLQRQNACSKTMYTLFTVPTYWLSKISFLLSEIEVISIWLMTAMGTEKKTYLQTYTLLEFFTYILISSLPELSILTTGEFFIRISSYFLSGFKHFACLTILLNMFWGTVNIPYSTLIPSMVFSALPVQYLSSSRQLSSSKSCIMLSLSPPMHSRVSISLRISFASCSLLSSWRMKSLTDRVSQMSINSLSFQLWVLFSMVSLMM